MTGRNLPARKVATRLPYFGAIVADLSAFYRVGRRAISSGNRSIAEDVRDRAGNEAMSLAVDQRDIPDSGKRVDSIGERALRERLDGRRRLLHELGWGQAHNPVNHDSASVHSRAILGRSVQDAAVDERRSRGPRGSDVRLHRVQCVRFPRPLEVPRMPHEQRHVFANLAVRTGEPPPALVSEDGGVEGRDTRYERAYLLPSCREIDRAMQANLPRFVRLRNTIDFPAVDDKIRIRRVDRQFDRDPGDPGWPAGGGLDGPDHPLRGRVPEIFVQNVSNPVDLGPERIRDEPPALRRMEPTDTLLPPGFEESVDGHVGDSDAPFFVTNESARGPTDGVSGLSDEESHHLTVRRNARRDKRRGRQRAFQVRGLAQAEVLTYVGRPSDDPEVHLVSVLSKGVEGRPKVPASECDAVVDATRGAPQDHNGDRIPVVYGPETRRNPSIARFAVVLKRPHAVTRRAQDLAIEDAQPALEEKIQVKGTDSANVGFIVSVRQPVLGRRTAPQRRYALERESHVHRPERAGRLGSDIRPETETGWG